MIAMEQNQQTAYLSEASVTPETCGSPGQNQEFSSTKSHVDRIDEPSSYETFFLRHLIPNRPCIFGPFLTEGWPSRRDWVADDGRPNTSFLREHFGDVTVPVANCEQVQYDAQPKEDMLLREYLQYWEEHMRSGQRSDEPCLYMKDMHFTRDCSSYQAYETPVYFSSDWLNEFWDTRTDCDRDDYRFVYMGPKGSWTPFHADVFRSYSWSANVCGRKRWILVPPGQEELLKDRLGNLPYDVTSCDFTNTGEYPKFDEASYTPIEVVQSAGEVIFVPSGWHHQVFNVEDTISINHNWFNGASISRNWAFLQGELYKVQQSISDCRDMEGWNQQCQLILKASSGMDYQEFFQLLVSVGRRRRSEVVSGSLEGTLRTPHGTNRTNPNYGADYMVTQDPPTSPHFVPSEEKLSVAVCNDVEGTNGGNAGGHTKHTAGSYRLQPDDLSSGAESHDQSGGMHHWRQSLTSYWHAVYDLRQVVSVLKELADCKLVDVSFLGQTPGGLLKETADTLSKVRHSSGIG